MKRIITLILLLVLLNTFNSFSQWQRIGNGLHGNGYYVTITSLSANGSNIYAGTGGSGVFLSTNNGNLWTHIGLIDDIINTVTVNGSDLWASTLVHGIYLSTDNGKNWYNKSDWLSDFNVYCIVISGDYIFAGTASSMCLSTDKGLRWNDKNKGLTCSKIHSILIKDTLIFAGSEQGIFLSTDHGNNWIGKGLELYDIVSITRNGNKIYAGSGTNGIFLTTDNGDNWKNIGLDTSKISNIVSWGDKIISATNVGVFISTDDGNRWITKNTGLTNTNVHSLATSGNNIFAGVTDEGVFRANLNSIEIVSEGNDMPLNNEYSFYPNPVQDVLNINVGVQNYEPLQIEIFDILGKKLIESQISAGAKDWNFDMERLPAGMYILKINSKFYSIMKN
jgi:photosystem II stability/assembly factor-like uncharacterized protein